MIAVSRGPGSFTGLRVGITTGKTLAYATGAAWIEIDTLDALASREKDQPPGTEILPGTELPSETELEVAIDAQRGEVCVRRYSRGDGGVWLATEERRLMPLDDWLNSKRFSGLRSGPILAKLPLARLEAMKTTDRATWAPSAKAIGELAWRRYQAGERDDFWRARPSYTRRSAAEEKAAKNVADAE